MALVTTLLALSSLSAPQSGEVTLNRVFQKGERQAFRVRGSLQVEEGFRELKTPIPQDLEIMYEFTTEVTQMKADGIAVLRYKRPTMTFTEGETFDSPPSTEVEKVNFDLELTVSPINDILGIKDLVPPKKPARAGSGNWLKTALSPRRPQAFLGEFVSDIYRLILFTGSFDSALDFAPRLPLDPVKVGDTWKQTIGYQPQRLRGTGKQAVQRLDLTYTYRGLVKVGQQNVQRVQAKVALDTDLAEFVHQTFEVKPAETGLEKIPLKLNSTIDFDLDPKTFRTLGAVAVSTGSFQIFLNDDPSEPEITETMKGRTILKAIPVAAPKPAPKPAPKKPAPRRPGQRGG